MSRKSTVWKALVNACGFQGGQRSGGASPATLSFKFVCFAAVLVLFCQGFAAPAAAESQAEYDVVVAGGGMGGIAAALQASRMGASVLVVEPSGWIGGQATAAGVSTMDDLSRQRSGLYLEFISRLQDYYGAKNKPMGTCYWDPRSVAFEPSVGHKVLREMAAENPLDIMLFSEVTQVLLDAKDGKERKAVTGITARGKNGEEKQIKTRVLIDATEYGDVLPLAGASYRAGNSVTPFIDKNAMIQDITWAAIIRHYPHGVPPELRPLRPLPGYEEARRIYEGYVTADGSSFKGVYPVAMPVNFVSHTAYRGLPDSATPWIYDGSKKNWQYISKTAVNWGNDYPGKATWDGRLGLPAEYLEDGKLRAQVEKDALIKTLHFIYYMQNELGESWSVADDEYYNTELPKAALGLPEEWREIARRLPPVPYIRESRRILGDYTLSSAELLKNSLSYRDGQTSHEFEDAIAIGGYILDLHGANTDADMEWEMDEKASSIAHNRPRGPFQVPMRVLLSQNIDGLLAAEKNLSMTRLASGALRLQPICMMVGQAAGALAALSAQSGAEPRNVPPVLVQRALLEAGVVLSLCKYSDVPPEHPFYNAVQLSNLYGLLEPIEPPHAPSYDISDLDDPVLAMAVIKGADKGVFGVDELLTRKELTPMINKARASSKISETAGQDLTGDEWSETSAFVTRGMFADAVFRAFGFQPQNGNGARLRRLGVPDSHRYAEAIAALDSLGILNQSGIPYDYRPGSPITRGKAADMLMRAMTQKKQTKIGDGKQ